jgi:hypothetical protein
MLFQAQVVEQVVLALLHLLAVLLLHTQAVAVAVQEILGEIQEVLEVLVAEVLEEMYQVVQELLEQQEPLILVEAVAVQAVMTLIQLQNLAVQAVQA